LGAQPIESSKEEKMPLPADTTVTFPDGGKQVMQPQFTDVITSIRQLEAFYAALQVAAANSADYPTFKAALTSLTHPTRWDLGLPDRSRRVVSLLAMLGMVTAQIKRRKPRLRLAGQYYGLWHILDRAPNKPGTPGSRWLCKCRCGTIREVQGGSLRSGSSLSCGCLRRRRIKAAITKHGMSPRKHPGPIYNSWKNMKARCFRPSHPEWKNYGARGIYCCASWSCSFPIFYHDVAEGWREGLQLGRINNWDGYHKRNMRWMSPLENQQPEHRRRNGTASTMWPRPTRFSRR
jgi:hypothetical protein